MKEISKNIILKCHPGFFDCAQDRLRRRVSFVLCALLFTACNTNTFDTEEALMTYIKDGKNGYYQTKSVNGYDFSLLYRPTDLLVKQEIADGSGSLSGVEAKKIDSLRKKYNKYLYFNLSMSRNNQELLSTAPKDRHEFGAMVNQLAFGMADKVHLFTQSKDTIELADFVYPRMYGMSRATTIMFVYPRDHKTLNKETINFTIEDLGLYTGEVKFKIDSDKLNNEPTINF